MDKELAEKLIKNYINGWAKEDMDLCLSSIDKNVYISECYGPIYKSKGEVKKWFIDWHKASNKVMKWDILNIIWGLYNSTLCVEWDFECFVDKNLESFFGVSLVEFSEDKIISIKEFESTKDRYQPYGK